MQIELTGGRRSAWRYELLGHDYAPLGALVGAEGGSCEVAALSRLGWSGSLSIKDRGQVIDWMRDRVRVFYDPGVRGVDPWPVCTMLFVSPLRSVGVDGDTWDVEMLSPLAIVDEDTVEATYSLPVGTPVVAAVVALIQSAGEDLMAVTESDAVTASPLVWNAGTPKLTVINDLLESIGYWALWCDALGQFRVEPYEPPGDRAPAWEFHAASGYSVHSPEWSREQNLSSVPNKVVVLSEGSDDKPAIVGVATNEDPDSPYSYQARGRWVTAVYEGVEVVNTAAANALAQRRLLDRMSPVAKLGARHWIVPLSPNDVVSFESDGHAALATVQRMAYEFNAEAMVEAEWREVGVVANVEPE